MAVEYEQLACNLFLLTLLRYTFLVSVSFPN